MSTDLLGRQATEAAKQRLIERHYAEYRKLINEERAARGLPPKRFQDPEDAEKVAIRAINALARRGLSFRDVDRLPDVEVLLVPNLGKRSLAWLRGPREMSEELRARAAMRGVCDLTGS